MKVSGKVYLLTVLLFILVITGIFIYFKTGKTESMNSPVTASNNATVNNCQYKNINPLRCEPEQVIKKREFVGLRNELIDFIEKEKEMGHLNSASVYFRDLQNGPILSINGQENFIPASLLKIPLMILFYKKAEDNPALLQKKVKIQDDIESLPQNIIPKRKVEIGKIYSIDELIELLITQSDNLAWKALLIHLRQDYSEEDFVETLSDLGIVDPRKRSDQQYISAQLYASILRILYNSSYLNVKMSDKALELLQQTAFNEGLKAGLPEEIKVAHKFGEQQNGSELQLHDCGIIYYPKNPYILCVMTKGDDFNELQDIIKTISEKVYKEVEGRN